MFACPKPRVWHRVHRELTRIYERADVHISKPPVPLILNGWVFSSARQKHERWRQTVTWAHEHDCGAIVDAIAPDQYERWEADVPGWNPEDDDADDSAVR
jgi:hypothetical protein